MINKKILARGQNFDHTYMDGTKYIYVQKHKDWLNFVHKIFEQNNSEKLSQDMVAILKELKENHNFNTINETIKSITTAKNTILLCMQLLHLPTMVLNFMNQHIQKLMASFHII